MPDVFSKAKRSAVMARIRGRGNKDTELALAKLFRSEGVKGWRRHLPLLGKPDFAFRGDRTVVFVDGGFWHGCPACYQRPASNREFWDEKLARNRRRDRVVGRSLRALGWNVVRIWEHELRKPGRLLVRLRRLVPALRTPSRSEPSTRAR